MNKDKVAYVFKWAESESRHHIRTKKKKEHNVIIFVLLEDGEVTLTEPPLVHFRTRHCAHQESFLTCPKLGPAARRICRYYSQCFALKCMSNIDDFRKNSRKCSTNLLQIWTCGGKIEEDSHLSVLESRGGEMWRQVEACLPWSCLLWKDKQRRSTELWNLWVVLF